MARGPPPGPAWPGYDQGRPVVQVPGWLGPALTGHLDPAWRTPVRPPDQQQGRGAAQPDRGRGTGGSVFVWSGPAGTKPHRNRVLTSRDTGASGHSRQGAGQRLRGILNRGLSSEGADVRGGALIRPPRARQGVGGDPRRLPSRRSSPCPRVCAAGLRTFSRGGPIRRAGVNGTFPSGGPVAWSPGDQASPGRQARAFTPQGGPARASQLVVSTGNGHLGGGLASRSWPGRESGACPSLP
jgi:hypothetical protein